MLGLQDERGIEGEGVVGLAAATPEEEGREERRASMVLKYNAM